MEEKLLDSLAQLVKDTIVIIREVPIIQKSTDTLDRVFETSPDTVYGVLLLLLVLAVIYLAMQNRGMTKRLVELNVSTIDVLKDLDKSLLLFKEEAANMSDRLIQHIDHSREHISEKLANLKN
jgi:hypothetical protein